jgi:multidrug efflux pump subunit AcrB
MAFFSGSVGAIYRQFAVTLVMTMLFSALLALTLTPALCATLFKGKPGEQMLPSTGFFGWFNRTFARAVAGYMRRGGCACSRRRGRWLVCLRCRRRRRRHPDSCACRAASCPRRTRAT